jgi:hypothetical protein
MAPTPLSFNQQAGRYIHCHMTNLAHSWHSAAWLPSPSPCHARPGVVETYPMHRSVPLRRLPALTLALLAVLGMLVRAMPEAAASASAPFTVPLCHAGSGGPPHPTGPVSDCDACLLCMAVHGHHIGIAILPTGIDLPGVSFAILVPAGPTRSAPRSAPGFEGHRARAPPPMA